MMPPLPSGLTSSEESETFGERKRPTVTAISDRHSMATDIDDIQHQVLCIELKHIEKIAGKTLAGHIPPSEFNLWHSDFFIRQERPLHPCGSLEVPGHLLVDSGD